MNFAILSSVCLASNSFCQFMKRVAMEDKKPKTRRSTYFKMVSDRGTQILFSDIPKTWYKQHNLRKAFYG